jgi:putrescine aminotransferase
VLDLTGGIGVLNHGHNHPRILDVRKKFAAANKMEVHKNFFSQYVAALGSNIANMLPTGLEYSYFANSGAEAVEGAVKIAYKYHAAQRSQILTSDISFHGKLLGSAGLTASPEINFSFPTIQGVKRFVYNDLNTVYRLVTDLRKEDGTSDIYALILEPLNASTMTFASPEFLHGVQEICQQNGIVLIFDEVYTGWGKTGFLFNFLRVQDLCPDILVYAKSFGGGKASISGYSYNSKVAEAYQSLRDATLHSTTYYGFGEETVTAIEALNIIHDEKLVENAALIGELFLEEVHNLGLECSYLQEIRGSGALWGFILKSESIENLVSSLKFSAKLIPFIRENVTSDPRFAQKLIAGSIVNSLYEDFKVLTYFAVNRENPLIISFPLVASATEVKFAANALTQTLNKPLIYHVTRFIKMKLTGPKSGLQE